LEKKIYNVFMIIIRQKIMVSAYVIQLGRTYELKYKVSRNHNADLHSHFPGRFTLL